MNWTNLPKFRDDVEIFNNANRDDINEINDMLISGDIQKLRVLGTGAEGIVYEYGDYAIKVNKYGDYLTDCKILKDLHQLDFLPKLYAIIEDKAIISEKINGNTMSTIMKSRKIFNTDIDMYDYFVDMLLDIVDSGYSPYDMHQENIMICEKTSKLKIVDVGLFQRTNIECGQDLFSDYGLQQALDFVNRGDIEQCFSLNTAKSYEGAV